MAAPNPYPGCNFIVEMGGGTIGFRAVGQISAAVDVIEYREGSDPTFSPIKLPGLTRSGDVVLRNGIMGTTDLFQWFAGATAGAVDRRDVTISLLDAAHEPVQTWRLSRAWPRSYVAGPLDALASTIAIEELVLTFERLTVA